VVRQLVDTVMEMETARNRVHALATRRRQRQQEQEQGEEEEVERMPDAMDGPAQSGPVGPGEPQGLAEDEATAVVAAAAAGEPGQAGIPASTAHAADAAARAAAAAAVPSRGVGAGVGQGRGEGQTKSTHPLGAPRTLPRPLWALRRQHLVEELLLHTQVSKAGAAVGAWARVCVRGLWVPPRCRGCCVVLLQASTRFNGA